MLASANLINDDYKCMVNYLKDKNLLHDEVEKFNLEIDCNSIIDNFKNQTFNQRVEFIQDSLTIQQKDIDCFRERFSFLNLADYEIQVHVYKKSSFGFAHLIKAVGETLKKYLSMLVVFKPNEITREIFERDCLDTKIVEVTSDGKRLWFTCDITRFCFGEYALEKNFIDYRYTFMPHPAWPH